MKDEIRYRQKIKRKYFSSIRREEADKVNLETFMAAFGSFDSFFIYNSFGTEADTHLIIAELLSLGKKVFLPKVDGEDIVACEIADLEGLTVGSFGIGEPCGKPFKGKIDVTVIPLLAVNEDGYRIGYGKGFYDRYLKGRKTKKIGLGYAFQIENFNADKWDQKLDCFVCEKGIYTYE